MTGFGIIIPVFPQRLQALGLGASTLALMEGAFGLGMFLSSTPMGTLADRVGRKPLVFLSLAGFILTNLALALVDIPALFILIRFVEGVLVSGLMPASMAMVGDSIPPARQGRWIGLITTAQAIGIALGPGIGGFLYQAWGFHSPFFLSSGIALLAALLAWFMLPETLPDSVRTQTQLRKTMQREQRKRLSFGGTGMWTLVLLFAPLLFIDFGLTFIYPFVLPQYPFFFVEILKYTSAQYGVIISMYGLSLAIAPLLLGRLSDLWSKKLLIILGTLLSATLNVGMLLVHNYALLIVASLVTGVGSALLMPAMGAIYLGETTDQNRSQIMGIRGSAISLAILLAPLTQAILGPWITPQITFAIGICLSLLLTLLAGLLLKNPQQAEVR